MLARWTTATAGRTHHPRPGDCFGRLLADRHRVWNRSSFLTRGRSTC